MTAEKAESYRAARRALTLKSLVVWYGTYWYQYQYGTSTISWYGTAANIRHICAVWYGTAAKIHHICNSCVVLQFPFTSSIYVTRQRYGTIPLTGTSTVPYYVTEGHPCTGTSTIPYYMAYMGIALSHQSCKCDVNLSLEKCDGNYVVCEVSSKTTGTVCPVCRAMWG